LHTLRTPSVKGKLVAFHRKPILLADRAVQTRIQLNLVQIGHRAAAVANKVTVGGGDGVEPLLPLDYPDTLDVPPLLKKDQIAVDCTQAQIRVFRLQLLVDPLR